VGGNKQSSGRTAQGEDLMRAKHSGGDHVRKENSKAGKRTGPFDPKKKSRQGGGNFVLRWFAAQGRRWAPIPREGAQRPTDWKTVVGNNQVQENALWGGNPELGLKEVS